MLQHDCYLPGALGRIRRACYEISECSLVGPAPRPGRGHTGAGNEPKASISPSWLGVVMAFAAKAPRLTTRSTLMGRTSFPPHRPDGSASVGRACSRHAYMLINLSDKT